MKWTMGEWKCLPESQFYRDPPSKPGNKDQSSHGNHLPPRSAEQTWEDLALLS